MGTPDALCTQGGAIGMAGGELAAFDKKHPHSQEQNAHQDKCYGE